MFDTYHPRDALRCPVCGAALHDWQGKEGPCLQLNWREGEPCPEDPLEIARDAAVQRLPDGFVIYSHDCACPFPVLAMCKTVSGTWTSTALVRAADVDSVLHDLPRAKRAAWKQWLIAAGL